MIADHETNVVFVADTLKGRFPSIYGGLKSILEHHGIPLRLIPGTKDIWCRDYMPIQVSHDKFVQFRYAPDYLTGKHGHLRADGEIGPTMPFIKNCIRSEIVLDGGNVVGWRDKVILTEKVFAENPSWNPQRLGDELAELLGVDQVIMIPPEPGDVTGHSDGMIRFIADATVVVNDYRGLDRTHRRRLLQRLNKCGCRAVEVPYRPSARSRVGMPSAIGNYLNFLRVGRILVVPTYGLQDDEMAQASLAKAYPHAALETLRCRELAEEGGILNCVTWTICEGSKW